MARRPHHWGLIMALAVATVGPPQALAQLAPPTTGGITALEEALRPLGVYKRLLIIGAHPDDEDTELLTLAVRMHGAEAAYLSLNRGEGGQNLIGPELGEGLGLIRTEELLAARRIDGARQFFTRAYDFGYSKSIEDTWHHWPRDSILKDVVRIVRRFRPQVIVSVFSGTPSDGHGQHQAAGWAAHEAFRVAGDSTVFPELFAEEGFRPWSPVKLYRSARFDRRSATLRISGGELDRRTTRSPCEAAASIDRRTWGACKVWVRRKSVSRSRRTGRARIVVATGCLPGLGQSSLPCFPG